jgi:hypothetical protein
MSLSTSKCATLKHTGRFGGSLSPNPPKNVTQPIVQPQPQHVNLQQHHLQKPNNQLLEVQTYQLQNQSYMQPQNFNVATVSRDYQQQFNMNASNQVHQKPQRDAVFVETSSILKKHREEVQEIAKPQPVFSFDPSKHRQQETSSRSSKSISIINQPLPEIPKHQMNTANGQVLSAATLESYRSLQRPQKQQQSYSSATMSRSRERETRPVLPAKQSVPILPPKNRQQQQQQRYQQEYRNYEREREKSRERLSRSHDDNPRTPSRYQQQQQQQQNFQTMPHHHHHPSMYPSNHQQSMGHSGSNSKSNRKSDSKSLSRSREMMQPRFDNYSATEL